MSTLVEKATHWTQRLSQQAHLMEVEMDRVKAKHAAACIAATTLEELARLQRDRIQDLEDWLRDICAAKSIEEARQIAREALW
jgi:hypothetical protein